MILFLKHIFRDIKKFPAQPLLIILTLVLSVSCAVSAFCAKTLFEDHVKFLAATNEELGDIIITAGSADTRILFESDAKDALGESAKILGDFKLTGLSDNGGEKFTVSISATDLVAADRYFEFSYIEYGNFKADSLDSSAIISKSFASKKGIGLGDTVTVKLLGKEKNYTVEAIAENSGLLTDRDMIVSIDSLIGSLSETVPTIGALSGVITPYTRLMIKSADGGSVDELLKKLGSVPAFSGYRIESTHNSAQREFLFFIQMGSVWLIAAMVISLAAILTGTSLKLLESKRRFQYAAFSAAGASRSQIRFLRYTESFIYSIIGGIGGILMSIPMTEKIGSLFEWNTDPLNVGIGGIVFGALFSPILILSCTAMHIYKQKDLYLAEQLFTEEDEKITGEKISKPEAIILPLLMTVCTVTLFSLPTAKRYIPAFILLPLLIRFVYVFAPVIIRFLANAAGNRLVTIKKARGNAILLSRSFANQFALRHVSRLVIILIALLFSVNLCRVSLGNVMSTLEEFVVADMSVIGVGETYANEIRNDPSVDSVTQIGIFKGTELPNGYTMTSISLSGDLEGCINDELMPNRLPKGHETVISNGIAEFCGVSKGDHLTVKIKGVEYNLTVSDIINSNIIVLFIDANGLGIGHDAICFNFSEAAKNDEALKSALLSRLEANGATLVEPKYLFGTTTSTVKGFMSLLKYATAASVVLALVGCINSLSAFYASRSRDFGILRLSGMSRARLGFNIALEFITITLIAVIFVIPICAALGFIIDTVMGSFGYSIFI